MYFPPTIVNVHYEPETVLGPVDPAADWSARGRCQHQAAGLGKYHKCLFANLRRGFAERNPRRIAAFTTSLKLRPEWRALRFRIAARSSSRLRVVRIGRCNPANQSRGSWCFNPKASRWQCRSQPRYPPRFQPRIGARFRMDAPNPLRTSSSARRIARARSSPRQRQRQAGGASRLPTCKP